jgi:hypothetical protein
MKTNRYEIGVLLVACVLAIVALSCGPTEPPPPECPSGGSDRTAGCDEFKRWNAVIRKNGVAHSASGWHPLAAGDALSADATGEAELNFSDCWDGRLYLFDGSEGEVLVRDCRKAQYDEVSNLCIPNGTLYSSKCLGEFSVSSGSGTMTKLGTSFSVTALPGDREISLVVVLEGQVRVEAVKSFDPTVLEQATDVSAGEFYFTMPDAILSDVAGLRPRTRHSVSDLWPVARELGIEDWMVKVRGRAEEDGVLPNNWPPELGGPGGEQGPGPVTPPDENGYMVTSGGGALNDPRVQEAMYRAVDWQTAGPAGSPSGGTATVFIGDKPVDAVKDLAQDPEMSKALLDEAGYAGDQLVVVLFPVEDQPLEKVAYLVARDLGMLGIEAVVEEVPGGELKTVMAVRMEAGEPVIVVSR